jgi:hypothetical protein
MNFSVENSLRYESNPYQNPPASSLIYNFFQTTPLSKITLPAIQALNTNVRNSRAHDGVFRTAPNITMGWCLTPNTRVYSNYFMFRDTFMQYFPLDTTVQSVGGGIQHDVHIGRRGNLQFDLQARELFQSRQIPVFDYIPAITYSHAFSPSTVGYVSTLLQLRGRNPFVAPTREIDPFYNFGFFTQYKGWTFSNNNTFVQNFRQPFGAGALIPVNSYSWINDYEISHPIPCRVPGLVAFIRAEPIFNFHSKATPGLSGFDFRIYGGVRLVLSKPPISAKELEIKQKIKELQNQLPASPQPNPATEAAPQESSGAAPNPASSATPVVTPAASEVVAPSAAPIVAPSATPIVTPSTTPIVTPSATPVAAPSAAPAPLPFNPIPNLQPIAPLR